MLKKAELQLLHSAQQSGSSRDSQTHSIAAGSPIAGCHQQGCPNEIALKAAGQLTTPTNNSHHVALTGAAGEWQGGPADHYLTFKGPGAAIN